MNALVLALFGAPALVDVGGGCRCAAAGAHPATAAVLVALVGLAVLVRRRT